MKLRHCISAIALTSVLGCSPPEDPVASAVRARDFATLAAAADGPEDASACRAAKTVVWARGPELVPLHIRFLSYSRCGWELRAEAAWRLTEEVPVAGQASVVAAMAAQLGDPDEKIRWNIARTLGMLGAPEAASALKACEADKDTFVAAWCVWSTCKVTGGRDCKKPNMDLMNGEPAP